MRSCWRITWGYSFASRDWGQPAAGVSRHAAAIARIPGRRWSVGTMLLSQLPKFVARSRMFGEKLLQPWQPRMSDVAQFSRRLAVGLTKQHALLFDQDGCQRRRLHQAPLGLGRILPAARARIEVIPNHARDIRQQDGHTVPAGERGTGAAAFEQVVVEGNGLRMPVEFR